jgi:hypothetical protein
MCDEFFDGWDWSAAIGDSAPWITGRSSGDPRLWPNLKGPGKKFSASVTLNDNLS